ncbi:MAG: TMEM165/GDT1 family protein [Synechococcales bacterium]|nr:TMEM165/GDT1 family protein [Synechococcales bacterium]
MITGFTAGLLLITLSELGDKTFFIGAILAMRHPRRWVFLGVTLALAGMTVLSVGLGQVAALLPQHYVRAVAIALFFGFGFKLLYDASRLSPQDCMAGEQTEALEAVKGCSQLQQANLLGRMVVMEALALTFVAEWGDRTQIATMTLATTNHPLGVIVGATLGHAICAAIAITVGRMVAGCISERLLTALGGGLFILFGVVMAAGGM